MIRFRSMTQARDIKSGVVSTELVLQAMSLGEVTKDVGVGREKFKDGLQGYDSVQRSGGSRGTRKMLKREEENQESPSPGSHMREVLQEEGAISKWHNRKTDRWPWT